MTWDLVVRGGIIVDGTGLARRRGDVAVKDNRIVAVGHVPGVRDARRTIDVDGRIGGFNFQWAWSTGYIAGTSVAGATNEKEPSTR